jgi:hypothetical protein
MVHASSIFFLDSKGKILIFRNYRGDVPRSASDRWVAARPRRPRSAAAAWRTWTTPAPPRACSGAGLH